ncbi:MAG TPA: DUF6717 family protein [Planctomycetaceae bacterium]|nr:DUF6717 family protein [Planctomycetaceae bacterium]
MTGNSISVTMPYKWMGLWVFDDESVGLVREPFVAGADTMIDIALAKKGIPNADEGFLLLFSAGPFPGADFRLDWVREDAGGNVYSWSENDQEGWLCPALLKYFEQPPRTIYAQLKAAK